MDSKAAMRKHFRVSVRGNNDISVMINDVKYEIFDISEGGIGILLSAEDIFISAGDELQVDLTIKETTNNVQGKVAHISPEGPEEFLCGIEFININQDLKGFLAHFVQSYKESMFNVE
jgi:c-di-GMP-binding flagellar brake protein YcgR